MAFKCRKRHYGHGETSKRKEPVHFPNVTQLTFLDDKKPTIALQQTSGIIPKEMHVDDKIYLVVESCYCVELL